MTSSATFASLFVAASAALLSMPAAIAAPLAGKLSLGEADAAAVVQVQGTQQHRRAHRTQRATNRSDNSGYDVSGYTYGAHVGSWRCGGWPDSYGYGGWSGSDNAYGSYGSASPYSPYRYGSPYYGSYGYGGPGSYGDYGRGCIHGTPSETSAYPSWAVCRQR